MLMITNLSELGKFDFFLNQVNVSAQMLQDYSLILWTAQMKIYSLYTANSSLLCQR